MGYRTVTFTQQTERKTYIKGDFKGKYYGSLNIQKSYLNLDFYDIHIYEGQIWNVKNHIDHPTQINETIYESVVSETQLVQGSFKNVISYPSNSTDQFEGFKFNINGPKLESVQITDVVKEGRQTFGTIRCEVSGYLSEISERVNEIEVETCDGCGQFLEECICIEENVEREFSNSDIEEYLRGNNNIHDVAEDDTLNPKIGEYSGQKPRLPRIKSYFNSRSRANWWNFRGIGTGCLGILSILIGGFFLLSFGLPGIAIAIIMGLIYLIGVRKGIFNYLFKWLNWILYLILGIAILGLLTVGIDKCNRPTNSIETKKIKVPKSDEVKETNSPVQPIGETEEVIPSERPKQKKVFIIDSPIEWYTGELYICLGKYSKRYHYDINCPGLSNCSTKIQNINRPEAERRGRTLCQLEQ